MLRRLVDRRLGFCPILVAVCAFSLWIVWSCGRIQSPEYALLEAVKSGDAITVQNLLNRDADVNTKDEWANTALAWAALRDDITIAGLLLDAGADTNVKSFKGLHTLHLATFNSNHEMVELLLAKGADVNANDNFQSTALMNAVNIGDIALVQLFLESGADANQKNYLGQSSLTFAKNFGQNAIAQKLRAYGAIDSDEIISGKVDKTDRGIVLFVDNGDTFVIQGKDLSRMIGKIVTVTGTLTEGRSGKILTVISVTPTQE